MDFGQGCHCRTWR